MKHRAAVVLAVVAGIALCAGTASAQCAMCRRALQSPEGQQMVSALRSGIAVLLLAPFIVFGTVATLAIRRLGNPRAVHPQPRHR
jgi:hypothetical protein